jgi:hypothetical protein
MPLQSNLVERLSSAHPRGCFELTRRIDADVAVDTPPHLTAPAVDGLARLLPLLGCGEEAASLAFDGLARSHAEDPAASHALQLIASQELIHESLIRALSNSLPTPSGVSETLAVARRFHFNLKRGDATDHLARVTALDSAVCTIFARLLRAGAPLAADKSITAILRRIGRDEALHVRASRRLALDRRTPRALREVAAPARVALVQLLALASDDFEALKVDPDRLWRDLSCLPDGLFGR